MIIHLNEHCDGFAENKDVAKKIREELILPAMQKAGEKIILDFSAIDSSTQSFIHALISGIFQEYENTALKRFEFKSCNKAIKSLITTVINYSLE